MFPFRSALPVLTDMHHRTVSLRGGSISIDEVDIATIGLDALRSKLALVPQDNVLFLGTLRENM